MEFIESARRFFQGDNTSSQYEVLNQDLQYLLKYKESINDLEASKLVGTPYEIMMSYFGMKLLRGNPSVQERMLEMIANSLKESPGYSQTAQKIKEFFLAEKPEIKEVSPKKISRVAVWGPRLVDEQAEKVAGEVQQRKETPVLIGYTGFFALKPFIENLSAENKLLVVLPERVEGQSSIGYVLKNVENRITVEDIDRESLLHESNIALVDDTIHTGNTVHTISELFPNSTIHETPLFRT